MIKENVNGIATPIKKLYENVNGVKQEIKERYELANGRKELVFKNKTIKTIQLIDANGNPLNNVSGGQRVSHGTNYFYGLDYSYGNNLNSPQNRMVMNLGIASGKKITRLYTQSIFGQASMQGGGGYLQRDTSTASSNWGTATITLRDNNNNALKSMPISYVNGSDAGGSSGWQRYATTSSNLDVSPNRVINSLYAYFTCNNRTGGTQYFRGSSLYSAFLKFLIANLWVEYEE